MNNKLKNITDITVVLDRSGSMQSIKNDVEGGFNSFIEGQRQVTTDDAVVSLYQFDTEYETVYSNRKLSEVPNLVLQPRAGTALQDAIGRTINTVGARLSSLPEDQRPHKVIILVITDGEENSSNEFSASQVKEMIQHQTEKYNWEFVFIGANQDAVLTAQTYGIAASNALTMDFSSRGVTNAFHSMTSGMACYRSAEAKSFTFTDQDREDQNISCNLANPTVHSAVTTTTTTTTKTKKAAKNP